MKIGIPRETHAGERRVAGTPDTVIRLRKLGFEVLVEAGAGAGACLSDADFTAAGATIIEGAAQLWAAADVVTKVRPPGVDPATGLHEADLLREGGHLICLLFPAQNKELIERLAARKATVIALDQIPRISRAQKMDVLSSMGNISGYKAVIEAANHFGGFFAGMITAAGRTRPARVLIIGAGVAGLAAIAAARGLGAEVRAFDVRPATKEQCESLGATFLLLDFPMGESAETKGGYANVMSQEFYDAEMKLFGEQAREVDIIITTALIPGRRAPILLPGHVIDRMKAGSVVVDLAAEQGGNCEYTVPGEVVTVQGVTILGWTDLPSRLPGQASQLFASNLVHLLTDMGGGDKYRINLDDEVVRGSIVLQDGALVWPPPPKAVAPPAPAPAAAPEAPPAPSPAAPKASEPAPHPTLLPPSAKKAKSGGHGHGGGAGMSGVAQNVVIAVVAAMLAAIGVFAPSEFIQHFTVFVLACFVGWQVVWSVSPALHTPLMSVTNAISGIIIVGGMLQAASGEMNVAAVLGAVAILVASINIAGGFLVTQRMLQMFRREGE